MQKKPLPWAQALEYWARLLSNLTDRELNDIGLQRHEIDELS